MNNFIVVGLAIIEVIIILIIIGNAFKKEEAKE